jgi:hypothetical protein
LTKETEVIGQNKEALTRFRQAVRALVSEKLKDGLSMDDALEGLAGKWNPLFDAKARQDLVADVNALVRDFARPIRTNLQARPPDARRIDALAEQLSTSKSLAKIAKKEPLKRYIELYILKCLREM